MNILVAAILIWLATVFVIAILVFIFLCLILNWLDATEEKEID